VEERKGTVEDMELAGPIGSFYAGKAVLVTGHTGFKGGWLSRTLQLAGADVHGLALDPEGEPSLFASADIAAGMTSCIGDVRDLAAVRRAVEACEPEVVFHLAAQALVRRSYREPIDTYATNVMGTAHLLEACRDVPSVRAIVIITTDKVYENNEWPWGYRETDRLGGADPYAASKACAELVTASYRRSFYDRAATASVVTVRAGNVIGGGDWCEDRLVPDIIRGVMSDAPVVIRNPAATRPWQHVLEPLGGYLLLGARLAVEAAAPSGSYNFGPHEADVVDVRRVATRMVEIIGRGSLEMPPAAADAPHEARSLSLAIDRARAELGWTPALDLEQALQLTAGWYRAYMDDPASAAATTDEQIRDFWARGA